MSLSLNSALIQQIGQLNIISSLLQNQATNAAQSTVLLTKLDVGLGRLEITMSSILKINREGFEKLYVAFKETISNTTKVGKARRAKLEGLAPGTTFSLIESESELAKGSLLKEGFIRDLAEIRKLAAALGPISPPAGPGNLPNIGIITGKQLTTGLNKSLDKGSVKIGKTMMSGILKGAGISMLLSPLMTISSGFMKTFQPINEVLTAFGEILGSHLTPYVSKLVEWMMKAIPYLESGEKFLGLLRYWGSLIVDINAQVNPLLIGFRGLVSTFSDLKAFDLSSILSFENVDFSTVSTSFGLSLTSSLTDWINNQSWEDFNILKKVKDLWEGVDWEAGWSDFKEDVIEFFKFKWLIDAVGDAWDDVKAFFTGG